MVFPKGLYIWLNVNTLEDTDNFEEYSVSLKDIISFIQSYFLTIWTKENQYAPVRFTGISKKSAEIWSDLSQHKNLAVIDLSTESNCWLDKQISQINLPGISNNKATENCSNSSSGSCHSHSGSSCSDELCSSVDVTAHSTSLDAPHCQLLLEGCNALWCHEWRSLKYKNERRLVQSKDYRITKWQVMFFCSTEILLIVISCCKTFCVVCIL